MIHRKIFRGISYLVREGKINEMEGLTIASCITFMANPEILDEIENDFSRLNGEAALEILREISEEMY